MFSEKIKKMYQLENRIFLQNEPLNFQFFLALCLSEQFEVPFTLKSTKKDGNTRNYLRNRPA